MTGSPYGASCPWAQVARRDQPVFWMPDNGTWCVTTYADVTDVLRDHSTFSSRKVIKFADLDPTARDAFSDGPPDRVLVTLDPPEHTRLRSAVQEAFSPGLISDREGEVARLVHRLLDAVAERGTCDLVADVAEPLAIDVITRLVGAPLERSEDFGRWAADRILLLGDPEHLDASVRSTTIERLKTMSGWLHGFVEERRARPEDDLTSALLRPGDGAPALTVSEVVAMIGTILSAGSSTIAHFIPVMMLDLLGNPDQWRRVLADAACRKRAVEECLRHATSVHGVTRTLTRSATLGGVELPAGADLHVSLAAAQRDPAVFVDPDVLDIDRPDVHRHCAFGRGIHTCLGSALARLEARIALDVLIDRLPGLRIAPDAELRWTRSLLTPGLERLDVEWDPG